ncbi:hypothetical protein BDR07DRAFT_1484271 [Suillus spraguei]|nr:hypothetical protein BDR07DRAFT_1484271 [Suillus spraguei]
MSTPPPVATTPITPTRCLSHTSDLSPNQLPFEMLDLGHTSRRSRRTWTQSDAVPSHRENSRSRSPTSLIDFICSPPTLNPILTSSPTVTQIHTAIPVKFFAPACYFQSMVPQIPTSVPAKPLPLPATIEDWLDQLVAQRFLKLSQNVLAPALRHAVDALVPSIVEQLTDGLSDGLRASIHPRPPTHKTDISSDTQSSDDEDGLKPHLRHKHPGKRGLKNHLHVHFFISELTQAYLSLRSHSAPIYERKGS